MKKIKKLLTNIKADNTQALFILFFAGFIVRLILAHHGTLFLDQNTFIAWGRNIAQNGFSTFYNGWSDYLPGYLYILAFLAKIEPALSISQVLLYKLPAILADLGSAYLVYRIVKEKNIRLARIAAAVILFNPAVLSNSAVWGQVDSVSFFFPLLAIVLLNKRLWVSAIALGLGALVKPQAALAAPVILLLLIQNKTSLYKTVLYVLMAGVVFLAGFYPFLNTSQNLIVFAAERLNATISQYQYTSVNAFNFWGLWGFWKEELLGIFSEKNIGLLLFAGAAIVSFLKSPKMKKEYWLLTVLYFANFFFFTRMHERHFLPAILSLSVLAPFYPFLFIPLAIVSFTYIANMHYAYVWITNNFQEVFSSEQIALFIILNGLSLIAILFYPPFAKIAREFLSKSVKGLRFAQFKEYVVSFLTKKDEPLGSALTKKQTKIFLALILVFALVTRLIGLGNPEKEYFDEVYHAFTARVMVQGDTKAWEWWNENPEGYAYEWTHPPVAKELMAVSMKVFGESSWAWRFPAAVFGVFSVFLIYKIGKELFNEEVGLLSAFVFSLDGLALVMSRIGMNDIYVVTFLLATLYFFLKRRDIFGAVFLGLALGTKWTTFWFYPLLVFLFLVIRPKAKLRMFLYLLIPPVIYLLVYLPFFTSGHSFNQFFDINTFVKCFGQETCNLPYGLQQQMWWYHTNLVATHPYTSAWWTWPLLLRPIYVYTSGEMNGVVSNIYGMGNPLVFWGGVASVILSLKYLLQEKRKHVLVIVAGYLALFVPWALSPRIMFFYHYFPSVPFLSLIIGFVLYRNKKYIIPFLVIATLLFIYFYPHWAGLQVPVQLDQSYYWLPGWR